MIEATMYTQILEQTLLPFIRDVYPNGHKFMADNNPKHISLYASDFIAKKESIGGVPWQNLQILIRQKSYGTN